MSYANRGMVTEEIIERSCKQYEDRNLAIITKVPTPVKVLNLRGGMITRGFYEKKGTVDFNGTIKGGKSVVFDSKETNRKSLPFNNIHLHQIEYMEKVHRMNGIAFLVISFSKLDKYYRLDIKDLKSYIKNPMKSNKKSIPLKYLEVKATEIKSRNGIYLDFLEGLYDE